MLCVPPSISNQHAWQPDDGGARDWFITTVSGTLGPAVLPTIAVLFEPPQVGLNIG